jgi:hypothetical protein
LHTLTPLLNRLNLQLVGGPSGPNFKNALVGKPLSWMSCY